MDTSGTIRLQMPGLDAITVELDFESMYRHEYPGLVAVATAITGDYRDGEDLVQDTMVRAFIRWDSLIRFDRPGAWCNRVLVNLCRSRLRRRRIEQQANRRWQRREPVSGGPGPDVIAFWSLVRAMPSRPRNVTALYYAGEHTTVEIARILRVPEGTVRSDLSRARAVLARGLGV
jgi:RNA polymerase sigma-70 factor (ECF subfamily)